MNYKKLKKSNAFSIKAKDNPRDRIEVEIGDSKQDDFFPQAKIMRWDNESNVSIRLIDDEAEEGELVTEDNKIKLIKSKKECHFYEVEPCKEHPEGGFEFEIILKEKPKSNIIEFSLEDKDV